MQVKTFAFFSGRNNDENNNNTGETANNDDSMESRDDKLVGRQVGLFPLTFLSLDTTLTFYTSCGLQTQFIFPYNNNNLSDQEEAEDNNNLPPWAGEHQLPFQGAILAADVERLRQKVETILPDNRMREELEVLSSIV